MSVRIGKKKFKQEEPRTRKVGGIESEQLRRERNNKGEA
jgi:hypothetical protein